MWIETSIHFDGSEKPCILCFDCAKKIIEDVDQNSTEPETRELLQDVREYPDQPVSTSVLKVLVFLLFGLFFDLWVYS